MKGYLSSIESFSTLDGPGIRSVVFLQGCPLRCLYCHNPETWVREKGSLVDSSYIIERVSRNINYISKNGGVTVSGGEPTCQIDFLRELLMGFKSMGLHTAVDTSGYVALEDAEKIMDYTDLFIMDIKHMNSHACSELTGRSNEKAFELLKLLSKKNKYTWIRCVMVPGFTDSQAHVRSIGEYLRNFHNISRIELLPYHDMAKEKYSRLGIKYCLSHLRTCGQDEIEKLKSIMEDTGIAVAN
jgi:pyruvate formate-lyase 1-activating enzyme